MRKPIITREWLEDFYAGSVKPKYKGSLKRQASSKNQSKPQAPSGKPQASSRK